MTKNEPEDYTPTPMDRLAVAAFTIMTRKYELEQKPATFAAGAYRLANAMMEARGVKL